MGNLDVTINDTWRNRELNLGDLTYIEYLKSDHWKELKKKAISRPNYHQEIHDYSNEKKVSVRIATNHLRKKYSPEYWIKNRIESMPNN